jgi:hypothetical protein
VLLFTILGLLVMGYHPGAEDDGVYLASVKAQLNPALYPHDGEFFKLQMQASLFDEGMAAFVRLSGMPLAWAELLWQCISILLMLGACWSIFCRLFDSAAARWGGVAMLSAMLTVPIAGTALYIADQYMHPRNLASALILLAVERVLARRPFQAVILLIGAMLLHPIMGGFGVSFCVILGLAWNEPAEGWMPWLWERGLSRSAVFGAVSLIPVGWLFRPASQEWIDAMNAHHWFRLYRWTWYEWMGALAPLALFWGLARFARRRGRRPLALFATAVLIYGCVQQAAAMILCGPRALIVLSTLEPMRYLHLVYVFLALMAGAMAGEFLLQQQAWRWVVFVLVVNVPMYAVQRSLFPASRHFELPGGAPENTWLAAFDWARWNTPADAYFALGARYLGEPGVDMHNFRALAERSVLADEIKDGSVLSKAPDLVPLWRRQLDAQAGWERFQVADFERLRSEFGVNWVVLDYAPPAGLPCPWLRGRISVCWIP